MDGIHIKLKNAEETIQSKLESYNNIRVWWDEEEIWKIAKWKSLFQTRNRQYWCELEG